MLANSAILSRFRNPVIKGITFENDIEVTQDSALIETQVSKF